MERSCAGNLLLAVAMSASPERPRNPGPSWGYRFLTTLDRLLPPPLMRAALRGGTWFALPGMPAQRKASAAYLEALHGRPPRLREVHAHFAALTESLWRKLRVGRGQPHTFVPSNDPGQDAFAALARSDQPALFGTMHIGESDLLGCFLRHFDRTIHMVRLRVGNSFDLDQLARRFAGTVEFIWINEPEELFFALKGALDEGATVALQCDRTGFGGKTEVFQFLGARREFPFTIYHLAYLYRRPVVFAFGLPDGPGRSVAHVSPILPPPEAGKAAYFEAARVHFQGVLDQVEAILRETPHAWFNFLPLNPEAKQ